MREISLSGFPFSLYLSGLRDKLDQVNITDVYFTWAGWIGSQAIKALSTKIQLIRYN